MTWRRIGRWGLLFLLFLPVVLGTPVRAQVAAYLFAQEHNGGPEIPGEAIPPDFLQHAISVHKFHHLITTEQGTTQPQHRPLVVTTPTGLGSASMFDAFARAVPLDVELRIYSQNQLAFEIQLHDALIVALEPVTLNVNGEEVEFQKIRFTYGQLVLVEAGASPDMTWQVQTWPF